VYSDFESIIEPIWNAKKEIYENVHTPCGFGTNLVNSLGESLRYRGYRGKDCMEQFFKHLDELASRVSKISPKDMIITMEQQQEFKHSTRCWICRQKYKDNDIRVRDHDHISGLYRGSAHSKCNLKLRHSNEIAVVFHNLRGYDSHLIAKAYKSKSSIGVIANTDEKYMTMTIPVILEQEKYPWKFKFIDSLQFLGTSLDKLVKNLEGKLPHLKSVYPEHYELLSRKGVYPYEYMNSFDRFDEEKLPRIDDFKSSLDGYKGIKYEDYYHAQNVWRELEIANLGEYHDLYLKTDVMLLTDVFEGFRSLALKHYELDPCRYITAPSLSWDALLKKTLVSLELISDPDVYMFLESGIRGGVSTCGSKRYAKANNPYLKYYDPKLPNSYIMYLDANNLYGWAMLQKLPTHGFVMMDVEEDCMLIDTINDIQAIMKHDEGYIAEVDLEYPEHLHDQHNDFPVAPECMLPPAYSEYMTELVKENGISECKVPKLIPNLRNKQKYVLHRDALKTYLNLGLKLTKVHRILKFKESRWMKPYIDLNTSLRTEATSEFEKDFYKLMNVSVFGKSMENVRNRIEVQLHTDEKILLKRIANPRFKCTKEFNDELSAVTLRKTTVTLNKPIYTGQAILDISKTLMYDYYYNHLQKKYPDVRLLYTDTDSLVIHIETKDFYKEMDTVWYDTSNYDKDHPRYNTINKKVPGLMKDEGGGRPMSQFVAVRAKSYSALYEDHFKGTCKGEKCEDVDKCKAVKKHKGVKKYVVEDWNFDKYKTTLFTGKDGEPCRMNLLQQKGHQIMNRTIIKKSVSAFDDKRFYTDPINSFAHDHWRTRNLIQTV
jgi:hypothetical protein